MLHKSQKDLRRFVYNNVVARWGAAFLGPHVIASVCAVPHYLVDWFTYKRAASSQNVLFRDTYPCLTDRVKTTPFDPHYFFQAAWLARRLQELRPSFHVDIGSSAMMINVLSASMKTVFVDYRPLRVRLSNYISLGGDVTRLPFKDSSVKSLSCLHVIEHIGLGRYGDPVNPEGTRLAAGELRRIVAFGGRLYLSVPVGRERVCFNAHRVFAAGTIQSYFQGFRLEAFSLVDDAGQFSEHVDFEAAAHLEYGCGLFEFVKKGA